MPVPQTLDDLNTSAALNSPAGSEPIGQNLDNYLRAQAALLAQEYAARKLSMVPPGFIAHFAGTTLPAGWLKANGALVSRTAYAALFAAIGTTYGAGDGATTFALPDLRGEFMRALDDGRGVDAGRMNGSAQADAIKDHTHKIGTSDVRTGAVTGLLRVTNLIDRGQEDGTALGNPGLGTETRPRNVAMLALIKY